MSEKYAIVIDAGFLKKKLRQRLQKKVIQAEDIVGYCNELRKSDELTKLELFRIYYYDCPPYQGQKTHPFTKQKKDFGASPSASQNQRILDKLELEPSFAVRKGCLMMHGWKLGDAALKRMENETSPTISGNDLIPDMKQKQVDMKIGLDIAWLSIKKIVDRIVLITGDQDFIPIMKFSRKEGVIIYLNHLGHSV
ncbi:MAG: NYN domain-containing protein, partial [Nitrospinales bacterium]